ncbi:hypothetical protein MAMC_02216 [Methylacidimicrobium cyclopophantes]|uniref:Uncharacterized protein n=2 Tax=Methylacidimicrobium cyclopophantes TaxID=1041766 RepID=A0A5E6MJJ4_9BACT|nr:hypothetical protein MAMC_02216 [Methylacidimicrobium cyclopophantes]
MYPGIRVTVLLGEHAARAWRTRSARRVDAEVWDRALADLVENRVPVLEEEPSGIAWQGVIRFAE